MARPAVVDDSVFRAFWAAHLGVIALTFTTPLLLSAVVRWCDSAASARLASWSLIAVLIGGKILTLFLLARDRRAHPRKHRTHVSL